MKIMGDQGACPSCGRLLQASYADHIANRKAGYKRNGTAKIEAAFSASGELLSVQMDGLKLSETKWCSACHYKIKTLPL